jgi:hypothetical protein
MDSSCRIQTALGRREKEGRAERTLSDRDYLRSLLEAGIASIQASWCVLCSVVPFVLPAVCCVANACSSHDREYGGICLTEV